jgi:hypothetical protein
LKTHEYLLADIAISSPSTMTATKTMTLPPTDSGHIDTGDPTRPRSDAAVPFREIIPPPGHPRIQGI